MAKKYVAITGGIGSGKSLAAHFLRELNFPVFSCDELYNQVIQSKEYIDSVRLFFPEAVKDDCIDRGLLSQIVFDDDEKRKVLNNLSHPLIMNMLLEKMRASDGEVAFAEVPLLFEGGYEGLFDDIIYIARDKETRLFAVQQRNGLSRDEVEKRMNSQFDGLSTDGQKRMEACKAKVILNNGSKEDLRKAILDYLTIL